MVKVKICGITNPADAALAIDAGADALGFIFVERSPRDITLLKAAAIINELPPFVAKVGVFVNATEARIQQIIQETGIDTVQLHGDEPPDFCAKFQAKVIKAFRVKDESSLKCLPQYAAFTWLLDSYVPGTAGGTGERFNWDLAIQAREQQRPLVLAGGLTPDNVAEAVRTVRPYAVDVSSGVERSPGLKDPAKVRAFIRNAKSAAA